MAPRSDEAERQARLMALIGPHHDQARATARRLCRSHADGDDLFHETVLRAAEHLDELRDAARFRYDLTVAGAGGRVATLHVKAKNAAEVEARAAALRTHGATVTVAPRTERVWGSVYAMAKEKLLHINVDFDGKTDAEVADDIRRQLGEAGWNAGEVQVQRGDGEARVEIGADDGAGRRLKIVRKTAGGAGSRMELEAGGIDETRDPGMTDAQLRDKIQKQLEARGLHGDVVVDGARIEIRVSRQVEAGE